MDINKNIILNFLKEHKHELVNKYSIKKIALFGSYARGEEKSSSDIDILVDMPSDFDNYYDLKEYLEENFNKSVDLGLEKNIREIVRNSINKDIVYV